MNITYQHIFWDLDGTLTDPMVGITKSVQYALRHFGINVEDLQELCPFIGPPLLDSFQDFYQFSATQAQEAILKYRERFSTIGLYENEVYPGIPELLQQLCLEDKKLMLATSKPEVFACQILEHFRLADYFTFIGGASLDGLRSRKEEVIDYVLKTNDISDLSTVVMVGDRKYDVLGAKSLGIKAIGVAYGYGSREELEEAGADEVVDTVADLGKLLL